MQLPYVPYAAGQRNHVKYIEVDVDGLSDAVIALNDSGCQLCVVRADIVRSLYLPVFGQVKLVQVKLQSSGACGQWRRQGGKAVKPCAPAVPRQLSTVTLTINESVGSEQQIILKTLTMMLSITLSSFLVSIADMR